MTPKSVGFMGRVQRHVGWPLSGPSTSVAELTRGSRDSCGVGPSVYTPTSKPYLATKLGNAEAVRRPAAVAARATPPTRAVNRTRASQDRQRRRISERKTSATTPKATSLV